MLRNVIKYFIFRLENGENLQDKWFYKVFRRENCIIFFGNRFRFLILLLGNLLRIVKGYYFGYREQLVLHREISWFYFDCVDVEFKNLDVEKFSDLFQVMIKLKVIGFCLFFFVVFSFQYYLDVCIGQEYFGEFKIRVKVKDYFLEVFC